MFAVLTSADSSWTQVKNCHEQSIDKGNNSHRPAAINNNYCYYQAGKHLRSCLALLTKPVVYWDESYRVHWNAMKWCCKYLFRISNFGSSHIGRHYPMVYESRNILVFDLVFKKSQRQPIYCKLPLQKMCYRSNAIFEFS